MNENIYIYNTYKREGKGKKLQSEQFVKTGFLSIVSIKLLGGSLYVNRV